MKITELKQLCENNLREIDEINELVRKHNRLVQTLKKFSDKGLDSLTENLLASVLSLRQEIRHRKEDNWHTNREIEYQLAGLSFGDRLEMADFLLDKLDALITVELQKE